MYRFICFDDKIQAFRGLNKNALKITVARSSGEQIGYCISTIHEGHGEIASLYVAESSRGSGVGRKIVFEHINWLKENKCKVIGVAVSQENEQAIHFYKNLGFFPNTLFMQQSM